MIRFRGRAIRPREGPVVPLERVWFDPFVQTCLADAAFRLVTANDDDTSLGTEIATPDQSWAVIWHDPRDGCYPTSQAGPRRLADLLERAHHHWSALNQPRWDAFGITVTPTSQWVYYDQPDHTHLRWDLPLPTPVP
ncbi:MAG: hypothetical protein ACRDRS_15105 [Pseudonocardiaceae bacterium]